MNNTTLTVKQFLLKKFPTKDYMDCPIGKHHLETMQEYAEAYAASLSPCASSTAEEILDKPFNVNLLWNEMMPPTEDAVGWMDKDELDKYKKEYEYAENNVLIKNTIVHYESCDCSEYGCSHGSWPYNITFKNNPKECEATFEDEKLLCVVGTKTVVNIEDISKITIGDFISICNVAGITLEYASLVRCERTEALPSHQGYSGAWIEEIKAAIADNLYNIRSDKNQQPLLDTDKCDEIADFIFDDIKQYIAPPLAAGKEVWEGNLWQEIDASVLPDKDGIYMTKWKGVPAWTEKEFKNGEWQTRFYWTGLMTHYLIPYKGD